MSTLVVLLLVFTNAKEINQGYDCSVRHRRNYYALTPSEQLLYIGGFQSLRKTGALSSITESYLKSTSVNKWQDGSLFFPFHENLVYELESAIRSLGNEYECFSLPYWDFTSDTGLESNPPIFETFVGGMGDETDNYCVQSQYWNVCTADNKQNMDELCYWTPFQMNCAANEWTITDQMCCLKRKVSSSSVLTSAIQIAFEIVNNANYEQFTNKMKRFTDYVHSYLGSMDYTPMSNMMATEDPIWPLLASFIGYIRALWTDCNDYDLIPNDQLQMYPNAYTMFRTRIKTALHNTNANEDIMSELDMNLNSDSSISVRSLYDISQLNIVYSLGSFWEVSKLNIFCETHLNNEWFVPVLDSMNSNEFLLANANPINQYIDTMWNDMSLQSDRDRLTAISSLSCDYVRRTSLNSCYDSMSETNLEFENGKCEEMSRKELVDLTLNDLLDSESDACLMKIRSEMWSYSKQNILLKQALCNGEFDYKCSNVNTGVGAVTAVAMDNEYGSGYDDLSPILNDANGDDSNDIDNIAHILPSSHDQDFFDFNTSLWSVIVWCCMFIFIFMMCCYLFTVKKDFETELVYKKNRKIAALKIYGSCNASTV